MQRRVLGEGLPVAAQGLGCVWLTVAFRPVDEAAGIATVRRALDLGVTFLDTADRYGPHTNEVLVGRAVAGRRHEVTLATKFGAARTVDGRHRPVDGRPDHVHRSCDASLRRLGVDVIDLYYQHRVDPNVPVEETWGAMAALVAAGKVRHLGICEASPATIRRAHATHPVAAVQSEYSLWTRDPERNGVLDTVRELGIGFVAYSPVGRGFLSGRIRDADDLAAGDFRRRHPRFRADNVARNLGLVDRLAAVAADVGVTPAQLALAWLAHRGDDVVPIPGTSQVRHLEENAAAVDVRLGPDVLARIDAAVPPGAAAGDRDPDLSALHR